MPDEAIASNGGESLPSPAAPASPAGFANPAARQAAVAAAWDRAAGSPAVAAPPAETQPAGSPEPDAPFHEHPRFQELIRERNAFRDQAREFQAYAPLLGAMQAGGVTPEAALARLFQQSQPATPEAQDPTAAFHAHLQGLGVDPMTLDDAQYAQYQGLYALQSEVRQALGQLQEREQHLDYEAARQQIVGDLESLRARYPILGHPEVGSGLTNAVLAQYGMMAEQDPNASLASVAEALLGPLQRYQAEEFGRMQTTRAQVASIPVVTGAGTAPPPSAAPPSLAQMTTAQRVLRAQELFRAHAGAAQS